MATTPNMSTPMATAGFDLVRAGFSAACQAVSPADVFNLPLFSYFFVLDVRPAEAYVAGHCHFAFNLPPPPSGSSDTQRDDGLLRLLQAIIEQGMAPDHVTPVVLIGDPTDPASVGMAAWLSNRLARLKTEAASAAQAAPAAARDGLPPLDEVSQSSLNRLLAALSQPTTEVWWLTGGAEAFAAAFPSETTTGPWLAPHVASGPVPRSITPQLLLGSRNAPADAALLATFGITHVVCAAAASFVRHSIIDAPVPANPDVVYLRCSVADANAQDMGPCFRATASFIDTAIAGGGTVLVQLHGRSRSASVVLAWMMQQTPGGVGAGLGFDAALRSLEDICKMRYHGGSSAFDRSLLYEQQLRALRPVGMLQ